MAFRGWWLACVLPVVLGGCYWDARPFPYQQSACPQEMRIRGAWSSFYLEGLHEPTLLGEELTFDYNRRVQLVRHDRLAGQAIRSTAEGSYTLCGTELTLVLPGCPPRTRLVRVGQRLLVLEDPATGGLTYYRPGPWSQAVPEAQLAPPVALRQDAAIP